MDLGPYIHIDTTNPVVGLWCDDCGLPGMVEFGLVRMGEDGIGPCGVMAVCMNCGGDESEDDGGYTLVCDPVVWSFPGGQDLHAGTAWGPGPYGGQGGAADPDGGGIAGQKACGS